MTATGVLAAIALASASSAAAAGPICPVTTGAELKTALADAGCTTINLAAGTYTVPPADSNFVVSHSVTMVGADRSSTTLSRSNNGNVVGVSGSSALTLSGVTIRDASGEGLGLASSSSASISDVVITSNHAGGIFTGSSGALTVTDSVISNNTNVVDGAGIFTNGSGTVTLNRVELSGNSTSTGEHDGGAIADEGPGALNLTNVTISGNSTTRSGGGIYQNISSTSAVNLNNVTIADNTADSNMVTVPGGNGGGLFTSSSSPPGGVLIRNSIVADNIDNGGEANDCSSSTGHEVTRQGYELIGDPLGCVFGGASDSTTGYLTGDPGLGPLAQNGGTSQTMALLTGSQALDAGNPATPDGGGIHCAATDQRGQPRGGAAGICDMGAFEAQPEVTPADTTPPATEFTVIPPPTFTAPAKKKCKKHQKLKHGKCVKKKRKK